MKTTVVRATIRPDDAGSDDEVELSAADLDAMRWGTYGRWRRVEVIGFWGLAVMFGYKRRDGSGPAWETVRSLSSTVPGFPPPRFVLMSAGRGYNLYDKAVMRRWGIKTGRLHPDGSPARLRPKRGPAKRPKTKT